MAHYLGLKLARQLRLPLALYGGRMVERKLEVYAGLLASQPNGRAAISNSAG